MANVTFNAALIMPVMALDLSSLMDQTSLTPRPLALKFKLEGHLEANGRQWQPQAETPREYLEVSFIGLCPPTAHKIRVGDHRPCLVQKMAHWQGIVIRRSEKNSMGRIFPRRR